METNEDITLNIENEVDAGDLELGIRELAQKTKEKKNQQQHNNTMNEKIHTEQATTAVSQKNPTDHGQTTNKKMPPIYFGDTDVKMMKSLLTNTLKIKEFLIKHSSGKNNVLYTFHIDDYKKARDLLEKSGINYYTFTPKDEKRVTLVLKGLSGAYSCAEVLEILKTKENDTIKFEKVTNLTTKDSATKNRPLPHFIVQVSPKTPINEIIKIKSLDHQIIRWERIHKPKITQCTRCQRFGHSSANCKMDYRCVKCGNSHIPGQCTIKPEDPKEKLHCTLCNKDGHPASYKGCIEYQTRLKQRAEANEIRKCRIENKHLMVTNFTQPNISFANVVSNRNSISKNYNSLSNNNSNSVSYNNNINNENTNILLEIRNSITELQKKFSNVEKKINTNTDRISILFDYMNVESNHQYD